MRDVVPNNFAKGWITSWTYREVWGDETAKDKKFYIRICPFPDLFLST